MGETINIEVDGNALVTLIWTSLFQEDLIPSLPLLIDQLAAGETELFDSTFLPLVKYAVNGTSSGIYNALPAITQCVDGGAYISDRDSALLNNPGAYASLLIYQGAYCNGWGVTPAPQSFNQPVQSDIPTLLVAGSFDPITPPEVTRRAGEKLSRATYVEIPNGGHQPTTTSSCAQSIMAAFIADPSKTQDTSCIKLLKPQFTIAQ